MVHTKAVMQMLHCEWGGKDKLVSNPELLLLAELRKLKGNTEQDCRPSAGGGEGLSRHPVCSSPRTLMFIDCAFDFSWLPAGERHIASVCLRLSAWPGQGSRVGKARASPPRRGTTADIFAQQMLQPRAPLPS